MAPISRYSPMIAIRHNNGTVHLQDGHVTLTISNIKQISEMIEKIKKTLSKYIYENPVNTLFKNILESKNIFFN